MLNPAEMPGRLEAFLRDQIAGAPPVTVRDYAPLSGGYSRLMARFTATIDGEDVELIARGDPAPGQATIETDRQAEWELLEALTRLGSVPMPSARWYDSDGSRLGTKTIILDLVQGESFLAHVRAGSDAEHGAHVDGLADLLGAIHATDVSGLPSSVERPASWDSYIDGLVAQWREAEAEHGERNPFFRYMATWLDENRPPAAPLTLLHGEFQPSNIMRDPAGRLLAIDWELSRIGDPREDLGWCKWVGSVQPPDLIGGRDEQFCARYRAATGLSEEIVNPLTISYFSILAAIRVFRGITQQIQAFTDGANRAVKTAYMVPVLITAHEGWLQAASALEAAGKNLQEMTS